jgi:hypothetical protein
MIISKNHVKIFQVFHKDYKCDLKYDWVQPIGVGGYTKDSFLSDAIGDNISYLNKYYCELTAHYWVWKNNNNYPYIGLCHYRRVFDYRGMLNQEGFKSNLTMIKKSNYLTSDEQFHSLTKILEVNSAIASEWDHSPNIAEHYLSCQVDAHFYLFLEVLRRVYPAYKPEDYFYHVSRAPHANAFVMERELFLEYADHLFYVLRQVVKEVKRIWDIANLPDMADWQKRYPEFLGEIFLGYWLYLKNINYAQIRLTSL